jgi:hypothetical protein
MARNLIGQGRSPSPDFDGRPKIQVALPGADEVCAGKKLLLPDAGRLLRYGQLRGENMSPTRPGLAGTGEKHEGPCGAGDLLRARPVHFASPIRNRSRAVRAP